MNNKELIMTGANIMFLRIVSGKSIEDICGALKIPERDLLEIELGAFEEDDYYDTLRQDILRHFGADAELVSKECLFNIQYWRDTLYNIYSEEIKFYENKYESSLYAITAARKIDEIFNSYAIQ